MHIEPGLLAPTKVLLANVSALGLLGLYAQGLLKQPVDLIRTLIAALFFSVFMQGFHLPVGPSELHFVGAMAIYLTLGFLPTLYGFALGLLLQGLLFDPLDLQYLAVNALSLILPLLAVHYGLARQLREAASGKRIHWATIVKLDALYYSGVTLMVGFWLLAAEVATPLAAWAAFATSYLDIIAIEPLVTYGALRLLKHYEDRPLVATCFSVGALRLA
ncbi:MAG: energy-coupling factor ABC transporter permease [Chromatiaceae bacterium]|nr:energy-coupling factor ABC transporter permease [Chromatiaceae bacterium]MBP6734420.1 energy-coupling factor ABC transporter permease [Chromatiaceae bacterium]MBP6807999.1 energy-coupling factor ABC transporter permease [Chromatiaceae bacterium]MBP8288856.1 energy-coupling factor ABC transporter permease [Chromatiaceae bacterium]MBP9604196.1 energy-coupling factor ABC transporter permease [Chromatiaceae bacterium]